MTEEVYLLERSLIPSNQLTGPNGATVTVLLSPSGGGAGVTLYFKMRALENHPTAPDPRYITWVSTGSADFAGAGYATGKDADGLVPVYAMVLDSAAVVASWEE